MTITIAANSFATVEGTTRQAFFKKLARATGLLTYGTATGGSGNTVVDTTKLQSSQYNSGEHVGAWIRISSSAGAAPAGQIRSVTGYDPTTGTLTVSPNWTTTNPGANDQYELWKVDPSIVKDLTDECLTDLLYMPCWTILSEVPDGDMEQSGMTAWGTPVNATGNKATAEPRSSLYGKRYMTVLTTAPNGYVPSALFRVEPGKTYHVSALARAESSGCTPKLIAYDETNGAEILSSTSNRLYPVRIFFTVVVPQACFTLSLRLSNVENSVTSDWDEVCFYPLYSRDIALPWWVKHRNQVKGIFRLNPLALSQQLWDAQLQGEFDERWDKYDTSFGRDQLRAVARVGILDSFPLFILGTRNETAYSDDTTDSKYIDPNLLMLCVKYKLYQYLSQALVTGILDSANIKQELPQLQHDYELAQQQFAETLNVTVSSPTPSGRYIDSRFTFGA